MIIGHEHKYVFVELPRTGSTAISSELTKYYGGEPILKKHATYRDFAKIATSQEQRYFTFSAVRNPMDKIVSLYFKYKTNQRNYESNETYKNSNFLVTRLMKSQYRFVKERDASFAEFFMRFYKLPYDDWSSLDHDKMDFVMRFENLAEDFSEVLRRLDIEPVRELPVVNKTAGKKQEYWGYFEPDIRPRAQWVFGPYFRRWGYEFPESWQAEDNGFDEFAFSLTNAARKFYWRALR